MRLAAICLRTSATQFSATTSISTLEPITGRKSETEIPRIIIQQIVTLSKYGHDALDICHP